MSKLTTVAMADAHERYIAELIEGRRMPGSGNRFNNQSDVRANARELNFAFAVECKSTLGKSIGVSRLMWQKALEQSHNELPSLALRFYSDERLRNSLDLIVVQASDFREMLWIANHEPQESNF